MNIRRMAAAALALALLSGSAIAAPGVFPQTWSQQAEDLRNPNNTTYVPMHK